MASASATSCAAADAAVAAADFATAMTAFAPFEARPALAVAVSGGRDSMALALLAAGWVAARGGTLVALTVDHGLRPAAAAEARQVGCWLAAHGIAHEILVWTGPRPAHGVQAAARAARYRLIEAYCGAHGVLHVLLGHQRDDQLETVRMRAARQTAGAGLAGMPALRETARLRLLRPLLALPRARLAATLTLRGQRWLDDPSNEDPAYERSRVRAAPADTAAVACSRATAVRLRYAQEAATTRAAARCVALLPEGYAYIDASAFRALEPAVRRAVLARCLTTVGGRTYPPRGARLDRLVATLAAGGLGRGCTLAGCRMLPAAGTHGARWLVVREVPRRRAPTPLAAGTRLSWDGRFAIAAPATLAAGLAIGALGPAGWRQIAADAAAPACLPSAARMALPALWRGDTVAAVPHLGYGAGVPLGVRFAPQRPLGDAGFAEACGMPGG